MGRKGIVGRVAGRSLIWTSLVGLLGCSQITTGPYNGYELAGRDARYYALAQQYYYQGDFQRSLEHSLALISQYPKSTFYDKALFYAGLNNLQLDSPVGSNSEASGYFNRLVEECPNSPLYAESNTWMLVLTSLSLKDKEITTVKKKLEEKEMQLSRYREEKKKIRPFL